MWISLRLAGALPTMSIAPGYDFSVPCGGSTHNVASTVACEGSTHNVDSLAMASLCLAGALPTMWIAPAMGLAGGSIHNVDST